eukprot:Hpha_TRINITY_DN16630_c3_g1::TRINITY_DN16630_c3_g1_i5::g.178289::m.178289
MFVVEPPGLGHSHLSTLDFTPEALQRFADAAAAGAAAAAAAREDDLALDTPMASAAPRTPATQGPRRDRLPVLAQFAGRMARNPVLPPAQHRWLLDSSELPALPWAVRDELSSAGRFGDPDRQLRKRVMLMPTTDEVAQPLPSGAGQGAVAEVRRLIAERDYVGFPAVLAKL